MKETYSLRETAALFKTDHRYLKARLAKGDFDYTVDGNGHYHITRESILKHLAELERKHTS